MEPATAAVTVPWNGTSLHQSLSYQSVSLVAVGWEGRSIATMARIVSIVPAEMAPPADWPGIQDTSGYSVTQGDLTFLDISDESVDLWKKRLAPLGMDEEQWAHFVDTLKNALALDGIAVADVRLRGSSAEFFSGAHKTLPKITDVFDIFRDSRKRVPDVFELTRIQRALEGQWPENGARPLRRPFDVMHRLGIDRRPSDYDVMVCSDEIDARAKDLVAAAGVEANEHRVNSESYDFVRKDLVAEVCVHLHLWSLHLSDVLLRDVTIAVFDSDGPPERTGPLSSHLRESDWLVNVQ